MAELGLSTVLGSDGCSVTTADDDNRTRLSSRNSSIKGLLGSVGEGLQLEDTRRTVPEDGLGLGNSLLVQLNTLLTDIQAHVSIGNTVSIGGIASLGIGGELVSGHVVNGQNNLDIVLLGLLNDIADNLATGLIEQTVANLDVLEGLLEGEGHSTSDDQAVDLGQQVVDQLDLVRDLGTSQNGQEGALGAFQSLSKVLKFLLHQEAGSLLGQVNTNHRAVSTVGSSESVVYEAKISIGRQKSIGRPWELTDVDVTKSSQSLAELFDLLLVSLDLLALGILRAALLLGVETQVLKEDDLATSGLVHNLFSLLADAVLGEDDRLAKQLLQLSSNRLQAVLGIGLAIGTAEVGHEDNGLSTILNGVLDGRQSTDDTLIVGDLLVGIERNVEVDLLVVNG